jgi:hypothetical protein
MIFFFWARQFLDVGVDLVEAADLLEHVDDAFVGAAVERALEGADGGGDRGVDVRERRDGDAGGEGGGVHAVIGMEDVGDVEGAGRVLARFLAGDEVEEMGGLGEVGAHRHQVEALAEAVEVGHHHAAWSHRSPWHGPR